MKYKIDISDLTVPHKFEVIQTLLDKGFMNDSQLRIKTMENFKRYNSYNSYTYLTCVKYIVFSRRDCKMIFDCSILVRIWNDWKTVTVEELMEIYKSDNA